jgi:hypothetical protein
MPSIQDRGPGPYGTLTTDELRSPAALFASILSKIETHPSKCIVWTGAKSNDYGLVYVATRVVDGKPSTVLRRVHRVVWEILHGPIPDALTIDHRCRNRACCNILHLETVTQATNNRRAPTWRGDATHCARGHEYTPENTQIQRKKAGNTTRGCKTCHRERAKLRHEAGTTARKSQSVTGTCV